MNSSKGHELRIRLLRMLSGNIPSRSQVPSFLRVTEQHSRTPVEPAVDSLLHAGVGNVLQPLGTDLGTDYKSGHRRKPMISAKYVLYMGLIWPQHIVRDFAAASPSLSD